MVNTTAIGQQVKQKLCAGSLRNGTSSRFTRDAEYTKYTSEAALVQYVFKTADERILAALVGSDSVLGEIETRSRACAILERRGVDVAGLKLVEVNKEGFDYTK